MTAFTSITRGPWRLRTSGMGENKVAVTYLADGRSDVVAVETRADLALLRDAINEYLEAEELGR
jgi:hypothetical protein